MGRGDTSRARTCLDEALALGSAMGELLRLSPPLWGLAETALLAGDPALAVRFCERGLAASESSQDSALAYPFLVTGTRAHLALGDPGAAERWVETMEKTLGLRAFPGTQAAIDHGRGLILMAGGSTGRARDAFESAVRSWDARQRTWEGTWARLDLAACLLRSNRPAAAIALLDEVRSIADRLGSRPLMGRVNDLAAAARTRRPAGELWSPLSAREFEVARLISGGQTNREIAGVLGIADKTVSAHVEHILAKLGASRRSEVAAWVGAMSRLGDRRASAPASAVAGADRDSRPA
jgi:DNA-binding CsgD family transcriptional regulator